MSRTARLPRRVLVPTSMALLAAASLALSGCAAGQYSQTADQVAAIDGANGTVGDIAVLTRVSRRPRREDYPAGSRCPAAAVDLQRQPEPGHAQRRHHLGREVGPDRRGSHVPGQTLADFATEQGTQVIVTGFLQDQYYGRRSR